MSKLSDKNFIADVQRGLNETPVAVMEFLELYCGFYTPIMSKDPYEITYSGGKRDVILTLKTIQRKDLLPEVIAKNFEGK